MLTYVARPPAPPLAKLVEYVWASQGAPAHAKERVVPTGTLELAVSLVEDNGRVYETVGGERLSSGAFVAGAYRRPFTFDPGARPSQRLCSATTTQQRFAILEAELASRLDERRVHPVVRHALDTLAQPEARVGDIAKRAGLRSSRKVESMRAWSSGTTVLVIAHNQVRNAITVAATRAQGREAGAERVRSDRCQLGTVAFVYRRPTATRSTMR